MYRLFISPGIVLGKYLVGEAHTRTVVFTEEFGLLKASARSARKEESKLRYGLEPLTTGIFTFVRGKHEWRLTGVERTVRHQPASSLGRRASGRILKLLLRLIHGEEGVKGLYGTVAEGLRALAQETEERTIENIECVLVLRILSHLGYLPETPEIAPFVKEDRFSAELTEEIEKSRSLIIRAINDSLSATGL